MNQNSFSRFMRRIPSEVPPVRSHTHGKPDIACDVAVVGAGVVGCSTAYWIARMDPNQTVVLVDAGRVGAGASGRNAGFLLQGARSDYRQDYADFGAECARRIWRFTRENRDLIVQELEGSAFELETSGNLVVAGSSKEHERLQESAALMRADGIPVTWLPPEETNRRLSSTGFFGSLHVPSGGMFDPVAFVRQVATHSGARLCEYAPVREVDVRAHGVAIRAGDQMIHAGLVVFAVNAWLPKLFPDLGRYVRPVRAQMLAIRPTPERWLQVPVYSHEGFFYARQSRRGEFLVGGARHLHAADEVGYEDTVTEAVQHDIEAYVRTHFSKAAGRLIERRWSGVMGFSPDHLPVAGEVPDVPGSIWAAGFSGHGMGYGFRFGQMLAEWLCGSRPPTEWDMFTADRFAHTPAGHPLVEPDAV